MFATEVNIKVSIINDKNYNHLFENQFVHYKFEGKDAFPHHIVLNSRDNNSDMEVFVVLKTLESNTKELRSIEGYHHRFFFDYVGLIPTKYRSSLKMPYNPNTYNIFRNLLAPQLPVKMTRHAYQQCYYLLVSFIQSE